MNRFARLRTALQWNGMRCDEKALNGTDVEMYRKDEESKRSRGNGNYNLRGAWNWNCLAMVGLEMEMRRTAPNCLRNSRILIAWATRRTGEKGQ